MCLIVELCITQKAPKLLLRENDIQAGAVQPWWSPLRISLQPGNLLIMQVLFSKYWRGECLHFEPRPPPGDADIADHGHTLKSPGLHKLNHKDICDLVYEVFRKRFLGFLQWLEDEGPPRPFCSSFSHPQGVLPCDHKMTDTVPASHSHRTAAEVE